MDRQNLGAQVWTPENVPNIRIPGLMYADDAGMLADSAAMLAEMFRCCVQWMDTNELRIGVAKCGIMTFCGSPQQRESLVLLHANGDFAIEGVSLPRVDSYVYLGLLFHESLDLDMMKNIRVTKGKKTLGIVSRFLRSGDMGYEQGYFCQTSGIPEHSATFNGGHWCPLQY